jgi:hypothetical protein
VVAPGATSPLAGEIVIETIAFADGKKSPQLVEMETTNRTQTSAAKTDLFSDVIREGGPLWKMAAPDSAGRCIHFRRIPAN